MTRRLWGSGAPATKRIVISAAYLMQFGLGRLDCFECTKCAHLTLWLRIVVSGNQHPFLPRVGVHARPFSGTMMLNRLNVHAQSARDTQFRLR